MAGFDDPAFYGDRWAKPGGDSIPVTLGDMAQVPVSGRFRLVYLLFNTLFGLLSQARQAECFGSVARVLDPGGMFVIECFVPDLARFASRRLRLLQRPPCCRAAPPTIRLANPVKPQAAA